MVGEVEAWRKKELGEAWEPVLSFSKVEVSASLLVSLAVTAELSKWMQQESR